VADLQKPSLIAWAEAHPHLAALILGVVSSAMASILLHAYWRRREAKAVWPSGLNGACKAVPRACRTCR
jgi:hypothetical protein